jgi:hypothetical protein
MSYRKPAKLCHITRTLTLHPIQTRAALPPCFERPAKTFP